MTPAQVAEAQRLAREWQPKRLLFREQDIVLMQVVLTRLGYEPGPTDGVVGPLTREAIRAFQRDNHLPDDGEATRHLMDKAGREMFLRLPSEEEKAD